MIHIFHERVVPSFDSIESRRPTFKISEPIHQNRMGGLYNEKNNND